MVKIQVDSQGKALSLNGSILEASEGGSGRTISCLNKSGNAITKGNKVWVDSNNNIIAYQVNRNYFVQGNLTVNDSTGIVSNFSQSNYIQLLNIFNPSTNNWEMIFKFNSGTIGNSKGIFSIDTYYSFVLGFKNKLCIWTSSTGSTWFSPDMDDNGLTTLDDNTDYYVKANYLNNVLTVYLSTDKINWTTEYTQIISLSSVSSNFSKLGLYRDGGSPLDTGSINLKESYIKINDMMWWTPYYASNITESMQTGIADENIAINSSGNVKVL